MANRKFAGITAEIAKVRQQPSAGPERSGNEQRGRPAVGKRSHPDWQPYTVLLRKATHKAAGNLLRQRDDGRNMSDLVESLLDNWIRQQTKA